MEATTPDIYPDQLQKYQQIIGSNAHTIARFGGRLAVLYNFVDAVLPQLDPTQRAEVLRHFRHGVEGVMSLTDDVQMHAEYHAALLEQTNALLNVLEMKGTT